MFGFQKKRKIERRRAVVEAVERMLHQEQFEAAHEAILNGLDATLGNEELMALSHRVSAAIRSKCIDLACNKGTDGSPKVMALEGLLKQVISFNGKGIYGPRS